MPHLTTDDGVKLFYRLDGQADAPVLAMSSSLGTTHEMWAHQMPALEKKFRVLRYDVRGHGQSSVPAKSYAVDRLGRDVVALLDEVKAKRVHFCGLSMGGVTGMWLGRYAPERIDRLVLCDTGAKIGTPEIWNQRIKTCRESGMEPLMQGVMERWFTQGFRQKAPQEVEKIATQTRATPPEGYAKSSEALRDMDLRDEIAQIRAKTLVICGAHDPATTPADAKFIVDKIKGARYVELPAAHISNVEAAEQFTKALVDFLTE